MWQYNNISFIYKNEVDSVFGQRTIVPFVRTYVKSKFALMNALREKVEQSYLGAYTQIDPRSVSYDKPIKV